MTELTKLRKRLHKNPELSGSESATASIIKKELEFCKPDEILENLGGSGIAASFKAKYGSTKKSLIFRAELDAIAVEEETNLPYSSANPGVMHGCGHDGHMTILVGLARELKKKRPENVNVHLLFQPAEETGKGAENVLVDKRFKQLNPGHAFALHNLPGYKEGLIYIKDGTFAAASTGIEISFQGSYSHAAYPEQGKNPALIVAELISEIEHRLADFKQADELNKIVCTFIRMGEPAFGISPGKATVGYTIRSATDEGLKSGVQKIEHLIKKAAESFSGDITYRSVEPFRATVNSTEGVQIVKAAAEECSIEVQSLEKSFPWSEDFGQFRDACPITIFGLGAGEHVPPLHSETYDFNDKLISTGVTVFSEIIEQYS